MWFMVFFGEQRGKFVDGLSCDRGAVEKKINKVGCTSQNQQTTLFVFFPSFFQPFFALSSKACSFLLRFFFPTPLPHTLPFPVCPPGRPIAAAFSATSPSRGLDILFQLQRAQPHRSFASPPLFS